MKEPSASPGISLEESIGLQLPYLFYSYLLEHRRLVIKREYWDQVTDEHHTLDLFLHRDEDGNFILSTSGLRRLPATPEAPDPPG